MHRNSNITGNPISTFHNAGIFDFGHLQHIDFQCLFSYKNALTFTGKEKDSETGFYYFGARYYDPTLSGLFLSVDPMADKYPSISPYAYCIWNPVKIIDPNGESGVGVIDRDAKTITISMKLLFYGDCATFDNSEVILKNLDALYNDNSFSRTISIGDELYSVYFDFSANVIDEDQARSLAQNNTDCSINYIKITDNIESKYEIGGNNGVININDINGTTPAHELGHGLGLKHSDSWYVGKGVPHIMIARGSHVDQQYQYDPKIPSGYKGSSMNPSFRKVTDKNIEDILNNIDLANTNNFNIGKTTNIIYDKNE